MPNTPNVTPTFADVKIILDNALQQWSQKNGSAPDLSRHGTSFNWDTKANLLNATGHGKRLIQPEVIGNGNGGNANLVLDLRTGIPLRMPKGGPFVDDASIQKIQDWIDAGCPD